MSTLREKRPADLQLCGLSVRTQEAYVRAVRQLADYSDAPPDQLSEKQLRDYFLYLKNEKKFAPASLKMATHLLESGADIRRCKNCSATRTSRPP